MWETLRELSPASSLQTGPDLVDGGDLVEGHDGPGQRDEDEDRHHHHHHAILGQLRLEPWVTDTLRSCIIKYFDILQKMSTKYAMYEVI